MSSSRQSRSQTPNSSTQTPSSSTPQSDHSSTTNFIYKTILNSPRMIRKAMTMTPSTDESPMSVRSESPYGKRHGLKLDSGLGRMKDSGDSVTMSAPNTPGSKRALMPRYLFVSDVVTLSINLTKCQESMRREDIQPQPLPCGDPEPVRACPRLQEVPLPPLS